MICLTGTPTAANADVSTSSGRSGAGGVGAGNSAETASVILLGVRQESDKENGGKDALAASLRARGLLPPLGTATVGAAATAAAKSMSIYREMSGYFLDGPTPISTATIATTPTTITDPATPTTAGSGGVQGGGWKNVSGRYALPVGDVVVGRDSMHDSKPVNRNKLRIGIDKRDEVRCPLNPEPRTQAV